MKVDLVVSTMMQQIDRNLQSQVMPAAAYRSGELLRGRVMLAQGEGLQIRLDNGTLLNAMPSGDVLLNPGATVTLRVTGQMDGQLVMQLLEQDLSGSRGAGSAQDGAALLRRMGLEQSQQGKALLQAMERMKLPMQEETVRTALDTLARYPGLSAEKAVFLAANRIPANASSVDALNRLVDERAMTGDELTRLATLLAKDGEPEAAGSRQLLPVGLPHLQDDGAAQAQTQQPARAGLENSQQINDALTGGRNQAQGSTPPADEAGWQAGLPAQAAGQSQGVSPARTPGAQPGVLAPPPPGLPGADAEAVAQLQSLVQVAFGDQANDRYAGALTALDRSGLARQAVAAALEGPLLGSAELQQRVEYLVGALPQAEAAETRQFLQGLVAELSKYIPREAAQPQPAADTALGGVLREITGLFARLDGDAAQELAQAASSQKGKVAQLLADASAAGSAGQDAVRQLGRVAGQVQLIHDISQYAYQQIPVMIEDRQKTVELYVMNKGSKSGRKVRADQANILIALDTDSMGHIETLINVNQKSLRLRFGVEKPELARYVENHMTDFGRAMGEIGYRVSDLRTQVISKPVSPLTVAERVEQEPSAGALDMRL